MAIPRKLKIAKIDRKLAKALRDLNLIIPTRELAKKFGLKPHQVYYQKKYRKRVPLPKRKRDKIIAYWEYLKKAPKGEDLIYQYRVIASRIKPSVTLSRKISKEVIEKIGVEEIAKKLKVKPATVKRWKEEGILGAGLKVKKKFHQLYTALKVELVGLFLIKVRYKKRGAPYREIVYHRYFNGTEEEFLNYLIEKTYGKEIKVEDQLVGQVGRFGGKETAYFLQKNLSKVDEVKLLKSLEACYNFLSENFKGRTLKQLLNILKNYG